MSKFIRALAITCAALSLLACNSDDSESVESNESRKNSEVSDQANEFLENPMWAKQKTGECLMRLEHATKEKNADMLKQVSQDRNCRLASAAHAEHVNSGQIEPVSEEEADHSHHHH